MSRKPADVSSKERNEYIPQFIAKRPFYIPDDADTSTAADYLEHQRLHKDADLERRDLNKWYNRGKRAGPAATKYRKGACENCGAMTHKTKECLSRPRKKGAKWTGKDIQADELIQDVELGWDAKRDRWNGYDPSEYRKVVEEYEELEDLKREAKHGQDGISKTTAARGEAGDEENSGDERYAEESDMRKHQSTATRNLRIREDTAKYLVNLDLDSAKYDPKTRRLVDAGATADQSSALVAEENFIRASGDAAEFERANRLAWEAQEKGATPGGQGERVHIQANPTSTLFTKKKQNEEEERKRAEKKKALLEKYGGAEHLQPAPLREAGVIENERFVEYDETGLIKGREKEAIKSKYPEDVMVNNHTSVWGSWWGNFTWGYACCHSTVKNSYCTGEEGKRAFEEVKNMLVTNAQGEDQAQRENGDERALPDGETEEADSRENEKEKARATSNLKKRTLQELTQG
ncbi:mRNA splicing protein, partial [Ascosphaera atra]